MTSPFWNIILTVVECGPSCLIVTNGSFTLPETDSGMDSDSDSKPNGYIVLCKTCSHCTDSDLGPYSPFLCRTRFWIWMCTRVHLQQCQWVIMLIENDLGVVSFTLACKRVRPTLARLHLPITSPFFVIFLMLCVNSTTELHWLHF